MGVKTVFVRPGVKAGLRRLAAGGHSVGIWSSLTMTTTDALVQTVFSEFKFAFVWAQDHTPPDTFIQPASLDDPDGIHARSRTALLWRCRVTGPQFDARNTVFVDDDVCEARHFAHNLLWLPPYDVADVAAAMLDETLGFNAAMDIVLSRLSDADDVRTLLPERVTVSPLPQQYREP